jgi:Protein of unknown function (DUF3379)
VNCEEARLLIGAEPQASAPELQAHVQQCAGCARFREEMRALDADIRRALARPPVAAAARSRRQPMPWRRWALAASVVFATLAVFGVWLRPSDSLAHEVVQHIQQEPESWLAAEHVDAAQIDKSLRGAGVELNVTSDIVLYAQSCWFRGHYVPHLVLQTARGPVTIIILRHEQVRARGSFQESGMTGVIVPAQPGSIAVLARGRANPDALAGEMQHDVRWLPGTR